VPTLYAHRGASKECPENTLVSFRRALEVGADALELDAHMSADGHVVVSHDANAQRMCGVDRLFRRSSLDQIKSWDAGHGFLCDQDERPFAGLGHTVPTLEEVVREFEVPLNIDLKQSSPSIVPSTLHTLRRHRAETRVTLTSFRWRTVLEARVRGHRGPTGLSQPECATLLASGLAFRALPLTGAVAQLPLSVGPLQLAKKSTIDRCHRLGLRVDFWTINSLAQARELLEMGADGIMTDDPGALRAAFQSPVAVSQ